nr:alpha/beta hydrolase [Corynebacterium lactis]
MSSNQTPNSDIVNLPSEPSEALDNFVPVTTDEGKLQQLIEWLEEHVSAYSYIGEVAPLGASAEELQAARDSVNARGARMPDEIVHGSMMVLGAAVNHTSPYVAYANGTVDVEDTVVGDVPVRIFTPEEPTGSVVVAAHGGGFWMGNGALRDNAFAANMAALAARSGAIVVDVDYKLAPEHKVETASDDIAVVIEAVAAGTVNLGDKGARPINADNPVVVYGVSSGGHNAVRAASKVSYSIPIALLLVSPALDLRGAPDSWLAEFFGTKDETSIEVSPGLHAPERPLQVHVQSATKDTVVRPATDYLAKVREAGGETSTSLFLATHQVATPTVQREQITDAARFILEVTHTERDLPADPAGEYDKEAIDRQNEESWGK